MDDVGRGFMDSGVVVVVLSPMNNYIERSNQLTRF